MSTSEGVDDVDGVRLPTPFGITLNVQTGHAMSSIVDFKVGTGLLQQGIPVEVGIGSTAREASLMTVVVLQMVMVPSQSTAGGGGGSLSGHLDRCRYRFKPVTASLKLNIKSEKNNK